jgi:hypothetical protein
MATYADEIIPNCRLLIEAFESVRCDLHPTQQEIVQFRLHHLSSLLRRFSVAVSLANGSSVDDILQVIADLRGVLEFHTTSSTVFRLWKRSNIQVFEFAIKGVMDLIDLKDVSRPASEEIMSLYQMLWRQNSTWDLGMDDTMVWFWTSHANRSS